MAFTGCLRIPTIPRFDGPEHHTREGASRNLSKPIASQEIGASCASKVQIDEMPVDSQSVMLIFLFVVQSAEKRA